MTAFGWTLLLGAVMVGLSAAALVSRRSLIGVLVGAELGLGGCILLTAALFALRGRAGATGQVLVAALLAGAVASAVVLLALHARSPREGTATGEGRG